MILDDNILLSNGVKMPRYGFGTWFIEKKDAAAAVLNAIKLGYRRINIDANFQNLTEIGNTLNSTNKRIFVGVELPASINKDNVEQVIEQLLVTLQLNSVDMLLLRKNETWTEILAVWQSLVKALETGKTKSLGVVDFSKEEIQKLGSEGLTFPMVNQAVVRIGQTPDELLKFDYDHNIVTEAYSPVPHGLALKAPIVKEIADKHEVSINQLCLRYDWQLGLAIWRQTTNLKHMKENADIDFEISEQDMKTLRKLQIVE